MNERKCLLIADGACSSVELVYTCPVAQICASRSWPYPTPNRNPTRCYEPVISGLCADGDMDTARQVSMAAVMHMDNLGVRLAGQDVAGDA